MNDKILKRAEARIDAKRHFADDRARENLLIAYKNPKFKEEWDELEDEYQIIENIVKARIEAHMTQTQLSEITGITQSDISKIENGNGNPSLKTLKKISHAFGKKLKIEFV